MCNGLGQTGPERRSRERPLAFFQHVLYGTAPGPVGATEHCRQTPVAEGKIQRGWATARSTCKDERMSLTSRLFLGASVLTLLAAAGSCLTDFPPLRNTVPVKDASQDSTGDVLVESGGACEGGGKLCGGKCVPKDDPAFGCASEFCNPCAFTKGTAKCSAGQCALASCNGGFDNCDSDDSNGCEAELAVDPKNCGTCTRDCLDGPCESGMCTPIVIADKQFNCWAVAVNATHAYWTNAAGGAGLQRLEHSKSGQPPTLLHAPAGSGDLALDQSHVYWANEDAGAVYRMSLQSPGTAEQLVTAARPVGVAIDATHVYWTDRGTSAPNDGSVGRALKNGTKSEVLASSLDSPIILTLDATHAYWTNHGNGTVSRVAKSGGATEMLAAGKGTSNINGWGVVVAGNKVIWRDGEFLRAVPTMGGAASDLATNQPGARFLARYGDELYWGRDGTNGGVVMTGSLSLLPGAPPTPVTTDSIVAHHGIAVDEQYVYFTSWGGSKNPTGGIFKVARP